MSKKIAICIDGEGSRVNRILNPQWACKFPGSLAIPVFAKTAKKAGFTVVTGDIALSHVRNGYWRAADVIVVQEMDAHDGLELVGLGAEGKIMLGLESPIFAYRFYDQLPKLAPQFEHRILFRGAFDLFSITNGHNHSVFFPNFYQNQKFLLNSWNERKFTVMVAANKYYKKPSRFPLSLNPSRYIKWLRKQRVKKSSPTLQYALKNELQTQRLKAIEYFGGQKKLAMFGFEWDRLEKMPRPWQKRLKGILSEINPKPCDDKIEKMSKYRYAICFENTSYPGYVTEKIIDCLVAGVIPIYLGAPDISEFVPEEAFIDMRKFNTWQELDNYVESLTESKGMEMISSGQNFLHTPQGQKHSFEGFAQLLLDLVLRK